ncbi:MAG: dihydropteroate synthase [Longimicrobiaceae bacterium]
MNREAISERISGAEASPTTLRWTFRDGSLSLERPVLVGVLNVTPDSFSDGGRFLDPALALAQAERLISQGADMIEVGGESTRPGADPVLAGEELRRVIPVIRAVRERSGVPLAIDTSKPEVAEAALQAGAGVVNDVTALADPEMLPLLVRSGAGVVLMHMQGEPRTMQNAPRYRDVVSEVTLYLERAAGGAVAAGVPRSSVVVDPGMGFGKTTEHNLLLIRELPRLLATGYPVLLGVSRKSFLGAILGGRPPGERVSATVGACVVAYLRGCRIFRVHDVRAVRDALTVAEAVTTDA